MVAYLFKTQCDRHVQQHERSRLTHNAGEMKLGSCSRPVSVRQKGRLDVRKHQQ